MTQEDKELLLKDLCARLPYKCRVFYEYVDNLDNKTYGYSLILNTWCIDELESNKAIIKPYLRPLSSMTTDEITELRKFCETESHIANHIGVVGAHSPAIIDYMNKHDFDYRGLIEKNLALEKK